LSKKIDYESYIQSKDWRKVRERYFNSNMPQVCFACSKTKQPGFHLHHKTYKRLGAEYLTDLMLLCPDCHTKIHKIHRNKKTKNALWYVSTKFVRESRKIKELDTNIFKAEKPKK
jgi:5-methylcytosine-specific restriction endonuclease McrA